MKTCTSNRGRQPGRSFFQRGMSLLELMIALALGVFIAAGAINVYLGSRQSARIIEAQLSMQEAARFGFHFLAGTVRQAGYLSFGVLAGKRSAALDAPGLLQMMYSAEQVSSHPFTGTPWLPDPPFAHAAVVAGEDNFSPGNSSVVVMPETDMVAVRLMGDAEPGRPEIQDCEGVAVSPGSIATIVFFIGQDRQLYCKVNNRRAAPLVAGIENMQVLYGLSSDNVSNNASNNASNKASNNASKKANYNAGPGYPGAVSQLRGYYSASEIDDNDWKHVVAVQIGLLASSGLQVLGDQEQTVKLLDESVISFNDGRVRKVFVQTVSIRGRGSIF